MAILAPSPDQCLLVLVDVQERLAPAMSADGAWLDQLQRLLHGSAELGVGLVVTEQYPRGLGATLPALDACLPEGVPRYEKTTFSCFGCPAFASLVSSRSPATLVVVGIETHVCVQQTVLDALERGLSVIVAADAVASRQDRDRDTALALLRGRGVSVTTVEALLFDWLQDARHPSFKAIAALIR